VGFPKRRVLSIKRWGSMGQVLLPFCVSRNPSLLLKLCTRSPALLAPARRRSGPRQANRVPPQMVRSHAVFFLVCCEHAAGRFIFRGNLEQCGSDRATIGRYAGVWRFKDFLGSHAGYAAAELGVSRGRRRFPSPRAS
jgi:hypothetical protein